MSIGPRISIFPKCYFDELVRGERDYVQWIHDAADAGRRGRRALRRVLPELRRRGRRPGARRNARDGPSHVDALLLAELHASRSRRAAAPGRAPEARHRPVGETGRPLLPDAQRAADTRACRSTKASRAPSRGSGGRSTTPASATSSCASRTTTRSATGSTRSSRSRRTSFLALLDADGESPHFGVQYDPSNAVVGGFDPIAFLEKVKERVVTMHASDRYLVPRHDP